MRPWSDARLALRLIVGPAICQGCGERVSFLANARVRGWWHRAGFVCRGRRAMSDLCGICHKRPATLVVPVFAGHTRASEPKPRQTGTEHWCEPCRDRVFPPGKETAWKHRERGWIGEGASDAR